MNRYPPETKERARDYALSGKHTDVEIAAMVGVRRVGTIADWRREGRWDEMRDAVEAAAALRVETIRASALAALNPNHDRIAAYIQTQIRRTLESGVPLRPQELRALAGALILVQRVRRIARGVEDGPSLALPATSETPRLNGVAS